MRRKVQRSIRRAGKPSLHTDAKRPFESLREWIGLISAGAGIFAALLYLVGRSVASGYFAAMNIPIYQVSFSLGEYGEVAFIPLFLYPSIVIAVSGAFLGVLFMIFGWVENVLKIRLPNWQLPQVHRNARRLFVLAEYGTLMVLLFPLISFFLLKAIEFGGDVGQQVILESAYQIELISLVPLALDDNNLAAVQISGQDYYIYKGFHLLTNNNGKYYFFKEIHPVTCKPVKVYVLEARETLQVNLLPAVSLTSHCKKGVSPQVIVTPTIIPTIP